jgi:hypothetical protein
VDVDNRGRRRGRVNTRRNRGIGRECDRSAMAMPYAAASLVPDVGQDEVTGNACPARGGSKRGAGARARAGGQAWRGRGQGVEGGLASCRTRCTRTSIVVGGRHDGAPILATSSARLPGSVLQVASYHGSLQLCLPPTPTRRDVDFPILRCARPCGGVPPGQRAGATASRTQRVRQPRPAHTRADDECHHAARPPDSPVPVCRRLDAGAAGGTRRQRQGDGVHRRGAQAPRTRPRW